MKVNGFNRWQIFLVILLIGLGVPRGGSVSAQAAKTFTIQELAQYNGQNGTPAYVAVNGVVYDLTKVPEWNGGRHFCAQAVAGKDISFLWNLVPRSHRDPKFLARFPVAGKMSAAQPRNRQSTIPGQPAKGPVFTLQQLAKYNGQHGTPAYVAVNGIVYDLTKVPEWKNGRHFCAQAVAGKDISFLWNLVPRSHRDPGFLSRFPVAGRLAAVSRPPAAARATTGNSTGVPSLAATLLIGLGVALAITLGWLLFSLRKKKLQ